MSADHFIIDVMDDGRIAFIHDDDLLELIRGGDSVVMTRISNVDPCGRQWTADCTQVGGPILGPFEQRHEALAAEKKWAEDALPQIVDEFFREF